MKAASLDLENDPLWYKDAVIYQLHVKTFYDSDGDGFGDFRGLTQKLDYLKNLGVSAVWLLPFYPSPLKDDGYDIADYYNVHRQYGSLKDFKEFLRQAHARGIRVITELVINHTSDEHPWFKRARKAPPGSKYRNYYVWSGTADKYKDARIIFKDFEASNWTWDEQAKAYYWHRFYAHQPDLNFANTQVQREIFRVADFWFALGVDGLRLDAVPYLFEREGTSCENLPETHVFLKKLRKHVDGKFKDRMLLAEANQWPEDAVVYMGKGDECQMAFHFPLMPRMYMGLQMEDRFPIIDILEQTPRIHRSCQWAIFLRNHDELTLEMVTDEERDYMYRSYAKDDRSRINLGIRRRLVPLLNNDRKKIELMNILLLSLPGTPIIYYGDEIGMGDNHYLGDRDGVRTPMHWSQDRNAGFSKANPQQLYLPVIIDSEYHYETVNVETQERNLSSLLWWMKRVIAMRRKFKAFSQGSIKFLFPDNHKVLAFIREYKDELVMVVINLSRYSQAVEIDLKDYSGYVPEEVFSQNIFPPIKDAPYTLTLGPHTHYWLLLKKADLFFALRKHKTQKRLVLGKRWEEVLGQKFVRKFESEIVASYLNTCRWFDRKYLKIRALSIAEVVPLDAAGIAVKLAFIGVKFTNGEEHTYLLPMCFLPEEQGLALLRDAPQAMIAALSVNGQEGYLCDAFFDRRFQEKILFFLARNKKFKCPGGEVRFLPARNMKSLSKAAASGLAPQLLHEATPNTSVCYDNLFYLKLFRQIEAGTNPDVELVRYLTDKKVSSVPVYAGRIEYAPASGKSVDLGLLQAYVPHQGDAWGYALDQVGAFYEHCLARKKDIEHCQELSSGDPEPRPSLSELLKTAMDPLFVGMVQLLGRRTADMHDMLSREEDNPDFVPEPFSLLYQRSVYQAMGSQARSVLKLLKKALPDLSLEVQGEAVPVIEMEEEIYAGLKQIMQAKFSAKKIRIHGDYHLEQLLFTGKDFVIIDFEGDLSRPLSERRLKRSALRDVAGILRSFHYAAYAALFTRKSVRDEDFSLLECCADVWYARVSQVFMQSYFSVLGNATFLPKKKEELDTLLEVFLLDKAVYELEYDLTHRPEWVLIPLQGIRHVLERFRKKAAGPAR